nr:uncharacterized protein LOC111503061 [Leptinotarsa decemlineata]
MKFNTLKLDILCYVVLFLVCTGLVLFVDVILVNLDNLKSNITMQNQPINKKSFDFLIETVGCRIPFMKPYDNSIKQFITAPKMPICNKGIPPLFQANLTTIFLDNSSLPAYNISDQNQLQCCYKAFWRKEPKEDENDNKIQYSDSCYGFNNSIKIEEEFIEVSCKYRNAGIYRDMFSFVPLKNTTNTTRPKTPSVLVVGLDAVSRLNLHRQMPQTVGVLQTMGAVELLGYNKVGDNTFPNLIPVLTGMTEEELVASCWPSSEHHFDNCSFVWKEYKRRGYTTAYGEDASWMGLFNYERRGFQKQTVDYAYNYFNRWSEEKIGNSHNMNVNECVGGRLVYRDLLEYINKFATVMDLNNLPYFGFFWGASISHDYLNQPKLADPIYRSFFRSLKDEGHLENTVLIFMSDHGIRWGGIRQTFQGRMEERLPFVFILLPDWYKSQQPMGYRNLRKNSKRLTTPFDLHETLVDLTDPYELKEDSWNRKEQHRGVSLFRSIRENRTCGEAGIVPHWCTCQRSTEIGVDMPEVLKAASFAVENMNQQLVGYAQCSRLRLDLVLNARLMTYDGKITEDDDKTEDYMLTVRTLPGEGVFEVTLRYNTNLTGNYSIVGTISRLNLYGKQSSCITDFHLKLYCFCKSFLRL